MRFSHRRVRKFGSPKMFLIVAMICGGMNKYKQQERSCMHSCLLWVQFFVSSRACLGKKEITNAHFLSGILIISVKISHQYIIC